MINLHKYDKINLNENQYISKRYVELKKIIFNKENYDSIQKCDTLALNLYEKGYSGIDIIKLIEMMDIDTEVKFNLLIYFDKIRKEFRDEKTLITIVLFFLSMRKKIKLENILTI